MRISDLLNLSRSNLKRRKGRTILTVLGVIIGTCSIVMMVSIGIAINKSNEDMIKSFQDLTRIDVYNYRSEKEQEPITDEVIKQFKEIPNVKIATPIYQSEYLNNIKIKGGKTGKYEYDAWIGDTIVGMYREAIEEYGYTLEDGRYLNDKDKPYTVIAGQYAAYQFRDPKKQWPHDSVSQFPDENGVVKDPFINLYKDKIVLTAKGQEENSKEIEKPMKVVGIVKEDYAKGYETYGGFIMDIEDLLQLEKEYIKVNKIKVQGPKNKAKTYKKAVVKVNDIKDVEDVLTAIKDMGYEVSSPTEMLDEMKKSTKTIQLILAGLGSISMLVAAISIANTMTMAIYERRKEIGIMKVLGCEIKNIRGMFLMESAGIGFIGGVIGIIICYLISFGLNYVANSMMMQGGGMIMDGETTKTYISIIPIWLSFAGIGFATLVGTLSGYFPANKAVKISALTAIKND